MQSMTMQTMSAFRHNFLSKQYLQLPFEYKINTYAFNVQILVFITLKAPYMTTIHFNHTNCGVCILVFFFFVFIQTATCHLTRAHYRVVFLIIPYSKHQRHLLIILFYSKNGFDVFLLLIFSQLCATPHRLTPIFLSFYPRKILIPDQPRNFLLFL